MAVQHLITAFDRWRKFEKPLVLATIVETLGSTYSKAGTQMLIETAGDFEGLVSGGCLEGDLVEHARGVLESRQPKKVTYDMRDEEEDQVWGLGLGCNGAVTIFLQVLDPESAYQPFAAMAELMEAGSRGGYALVLETDNTTIPPGSAVVVGDGHVALADEQSGLLFPHCEAAAKNASATVDEIRDGAGRLEIFAAPLPVIPRVLLLGAGPDVIPVVRIGGLLGWRTTVVDHRPAYLERLRQVVDCDVREVEPSRLDAAVGLDGFDACVVMSHHYLTDRDYLGCLATSRIPYVGMLGPAKRKRRLFDELGECRDKLAGRARGPVGLDIGADDADSIALSIVAQIQAVLHNAGGGHLS